MNFIVCMVMMMISVVVCVQIDLPPGSISTINYAISTAHAGDIIQLLPGVFHTCDVSLNITKRLILRGDDATIDCGGGDYTAILTHNGCNGATVESLKIINAGVGIEHGGGGEMSLINVTVSHCKYGIIVKSTSSKLLMTSSDVSYNGPGVQMYGGCTAVIRDCTISHNINTIPQQPGGGVRVIDKGTHLTMISSTLYANSADDAGGIHIDSSTTAELVSCIIRDNVAVRSFGGGMVVHGINGRIVLNVTSCLFANNIAYNGGGVSFCDTVHVTMTNTSIINNIAKLNGNAPDGDNGRGGGVYIAGDRGQPEIVFNDVIIDGNTAGDGGGGVYSSVRSTLVFLHSTLTNNVAVHGNGGALSCGASLCNVTLHNSVISFNNASDAGGVHLVSESDCSLINTNVTYNAPSGILKESDVLHRLSCDANSWICGNQYEQIDGDYIGQAHVCGTLNVDVDDTGALTPGDLVQIYGQNILEGNDDYVQQVIIGDIHVLEHSKYLPITIPIPLVTISGPVRFTTMSYRGRHAMTYDILHVSLLDISCPVSSLSSPSPPSALVDVPTTITMDIAVECSLPVSLYCYFGHIEVIAASNATQVHCTTPVLSDSGYTGLVLQQRLPGRSVNVSEYGFTFTWTCASTYVPPDGYDVVPKSCKYHMHGASCGLTCSEGYHGQPKPVICQSSGAWSSPDGCVRIGGSSIVMFVIIFVVGALSLLGIYITVQYYHHFNKDKNSTHGNAYRRIGI